MFLDTKHGQALYEPTEIFEYKSASQAEQNVEVWHLP